MNTASDAYDDESSYDFESPLDSASTSPWVFSPTSSTASGSSASFDEDDEEDEEEESYEDEDSEATSPTATLSPQSPTFHPTGFTGPSLARPEFPSASPVSPERPAPTKSYPMSYSSFSNYHPPPPNRDNAPRIQVPRPPKPKTIPNIPPPPPKPATEPQPTTHREAPRYRVPQAPPPPKPARYPDPHPHVYRDVPPVAPPPPPRPRVSFAPPPPAPPPPPPPPMARSKSSTISSLRDAISSLEAQMSQLLAQKRELQSRLDQEVRVQMPVHRLPSELLSSIFIMGVMSVGQDEEENTVMLGTIMLVCRQWNEVALNTPTLWSKVNVSPHDSIVRAKRRLERSKSSPLDISINFGPRAEYTTTTTTYTASASNATNAQTSSSASASQSHGGSSSASGASAGYVSTNPLINGASNNANAGTVSANTKTTTTTVNVIDAIIRSMELFKLVLWRTRSLTLRVPNRHQAHAALMRCRDYPAPLLEHLTIHIYHSMLDGPSYISSSGTISTSSSGSLENFNMAGSSKLTPLPLFAGQTPVLKTCSFTSFNFGWDVTMVKRLRVLRLGGYFNGYAPTVSALLAILRECPELEELSLRNLSEGDGDGNDGSMHGGSNNSNCDSSHASRLGCGGHHGSTTLSALQTVSASSSASGTHTPSKTIVLPRLTSLTLYYASPAHSLLPLLSLPSLTTLTLAFLQNISSILQCLYTQALTRLPLKSVRIESCVFNEIVFVNLLRRLNGLVKLEMVDVEDLSGGVLRNLTALTPNTPSPLPRVTHLTLDGCTSLDFDSLRIFVEARLPPNPLTFKRFHSNPKEIISSASEAARLAEAAKQTRARHVSASASASTQTHGDTNGTTLGFGLGGDMMLHPARLVSVDVTRCTQISKEMVQWLRMYVAEVKCESVKGVWGDV
ncbi:hypothetical protein D9611_008784 [Ephemerocybe angulata]|uniref:F-box domain-containing protein n=1 Tax=Ephemerocybe angulata TaxID=980116 RepID=A0A8H5FJ02_9AGAR|nr:hypothetical protein D9611_008784 [Tulosesus angulatus]